MAELIDRFKTTTLTEGGADAFVEGEITTEIVPEDGQGWLVTQIDYSFTAAQLAALSADSFIQWSITRDSKASVVGVTDPDCIAFGGFAISLTTSGQIVLPLQHVMTLPPGTVFVEPIMYLQLDSDATGQAIAAGVRVHYQLMKLTEIEILRLLQNS